jgi:hypothetical protein
MVVDDAYGAKEWREATSSTNGRTGPRRSAGGRVASSPNTLNRQAHRSEGVRRPKFTVARYEGMFKGLDAAAGYPDVRYDPS